jgi:hypothetical protein
VINNRRKNVEQGKEKENLEGDKIKEIIKQKVKEKKT